MALTCNAALNAGPGMGHLPTPGNVCARIGDVLAA